MDSGKKSSVSIVAMTNTDSSSPRSLWGIDLGGTKIEGAILDPLNISKPRFRIRVPTEAAGGYDHVLNQISRLLRRLEEISGMPRPHVIGIGTPGVTSRETGLLKNSNTLCLNGKDVPLDLSRLLGSEVILANDANCCALAEALCGAAVGYSTVFGIILGTGVGGGIVVDGQVLTGRHGICGEWGHNPLRDENDLCYCGRRGCLEMVCSGPALERYYTALGGGALKLPEIVALATAGDQLASKTIRRLQEKFAEAIGAVINLLDPEAVVIGGGVGNLDILYTQETRDLVRNHLFNDRFDTPLLKPLLGDSAGVFGAALLATQS